MEEAVKPTLIQLAAEIASAYLTKNAVRPSDVSALLSSLHSALSGLGTAPAEPEAEPRKPAVNPKKSVTDDYIVSLEDGRRFKALGRHLSALGIFPEQYRAKWGLPADYPMVAPSYSKARSEMARSIGLGQKKAPASETPFSPAPAKKRGRRKAA